MEVTINKKSTATEPPGDFKLMNERGHPDERHANKLYRRAVNQYEIGFSMTIEVNDTNLMLLVI